MILEFVPNKNVLKKTKNKKQQWYKQLVAKSKNIQEGDLLFTVIGYGLGDDGSFSGEPEEIGKIL